MARFSGQCWLTGALADTTAIKLATQTAIGGVKYRFNWVTKPLRSTNANELAI